MLYTLNAFQINSSVLIISFTDYQMSSIRPSELPILYYLSFHSLIRYDPDLILKNIDGNYDTNLIAFQQFIGGSIGINLYVYASG